jgi:pimeloyl-ACP methyl ester carboxylesterase
MRDELKAIRIVLVAAVALMLGGCVSPILNAGAANRVIVVPGIVGDGPDYTGLCRGLIAGGDADRIEVFEWGCPWPLMLVNISWQGLHEQTEEKLAAYLARLHVEKVTLIGHSAGCGVILGAIARLDAGQQAGTVILLAPALSPDFNLKPALGHCRTIQVFYSEDDWFWQGLGPQITGEYDGAHRSGAGRRGFTLYGLDEEEKKRVIQHAYEPDWESFGVYGGHFDWLRPAFGAEVLEPLVNF